MTIIPASDRRTDALDNRPPLITPDQLQVDHANLTARLGELERLADTAPGRIDDDAASGKWQDVIKDIAAHNKAVEAVRVDAKEPYLRAERVVDGFFQSLKGGCDKARKPLDQIVSEYLRRKRDEERARLEAESRRQREEEERLRREAQDREEAAQRLADQGRLKAAENQRVKAGVALAEAADARSQSHNAHAAAGASSADLSRTRSEEGGSLATLSDHWAFTITDYVKLPSDILWPYIPAKAREAAVKAFVKAGGRRLAGASIFPDTKLSVR